MKKSPVLSTKKASKRLPKEMRPNLEDMYQIVTDQINTVIEYLDNQDPQKENAQENDGERAERSIEEERDFASSSEYFDSYKSGEVSSDESAVIFDSALSDDESDEFDEITLFLIKNQAFLINLAKANKEIDKINATRKYPGMIDRARVLNAKLTVLSGEQFTDMVRHFKPDLFDHYSLDVLREVAPARLPIILCDDELSDYEIILSNEKDYFDNYLEFRAELLLSNLQACQSDSDEDKKSEDLITSSLVMN